MKRLQYTVLAACVIALSACSDFFEPKSPSSLESSAVFSNIERTGAAVAALYEQFGADKSYRNRLACGYQGLNTDIEHCTKNSGVADFAVYAMTTSSSDLSTSNGKDPWGYFNTMIERANLIIEGIGEYGDLDNQQFVYYLGEALFIRSFAYSELVKLWGDVPARFESLAKNPEGMGIIKTDRNVIYEQLRTDLKRAAELLPWAAECPAEANNYTGRPSKAAALALLARIDLNYAGYALRPDFIQQGGGAPYKVQLNTQDAALRKALCQEALDVCAQIMNNSNEDKKLLGDYAKVFQNVCADVTNYNESEVIWEIPFANGTRGQVLQYNMPKNDKCLKALKNNLSGSSNSIVTLVPTAWYDYEAGDVRRDVTAVPYCWFADDASSVVSDAEAREVVMSGTTGTTTRLYQKLQSISTFYMAKYRPEWMVRTRDGNDDGVNFPIIRYADVVLMFCEASLGGITGDVPQNNSGLNPQAQFNRIRARAGLPNKDLNMQNLMDERKFEFAGEYIRKYDLQRWGKLKEKMVETTARLALLDKHEGEFSTTTDSVYFKYRRDDSFVYTGEGAVVSSAYVMDSVWGLRKGETERPASFSKENGWVAKNSYRGDDGAKLSDYILYQEEDDIDKRHFYPVFLVNVGASNGTLWNDYDYE